MTIKIERESVERLECPVSAPSDPTGFPVEFAFTAIGERPIEWHEGSWVSATVARTPALGSGALDLAPGRWQVWIRIDAGVDIPVLQGDKLIVS